MIPASRPRTIHPMIPMVPPFVRKGQADAPDGRERSRRATIATVVAPTAVSPSPSPASSRPCRRRRGASTSEPSIFSTPTGDACRSIRLLHCALSLQPCSSDTRRPRRETERACRRGRGHDGWRRLDTRPVLQLQRPRDALAERDGVPRDPRDDRHPRAGARGGGQRAGADGPARPGRTPVREALRDLARERLVEVYPRRGIFVSSIDVGDIAGLRGARRPRRRWRRGSRRPARRRRIDMRSTGSSRSCRPWDARRTIVV